MDIKRDRGSLDAQFSRGRQCINVNLIALSNAFSSPHYKSYLSYKRHIIIIIIIMRPP